jgi:hypothetical protein
MQTNTDQSLEVRLKGAAKVMRWASIGIVASERNAQGALDAVLEARQVDTDASSHAAVAELSLRSLIKNGAAPKQSMCDTAAKDLDVMALVVAERLADRPAYDRPRG